MFHVGESSAVLSVSDFKRGLLFQMFLKLCWEFKSSLICWFKLGSKYDKSFSLGCALIKRFYALVLNYMLPTVLCMMLGMVYTCFKAWHVALENGCVDAYENSEVNVMT